MAHYAYVDENNVVTQVIVGKDEGTEGIDWEQYYGAVRCSYNTHGGQHPNGTPFRMNYPGIGWTFDPDFGVDGAFIPPQPFPSWTLDNNANWQPPIPYPNDDNLYTWNEENGAWEEIS
jgi:hypothetical protein